MELGAERTSSKAGQTSNLVVSVAKDVVKDEHAPGARGERGNRALEVYRLFDVDGWHLPTIDREVSAIIHFSFVCRANAGDAPPIGAHPHEHRIDGNAMQPGRKRCVATECRQALPSGDKNILRELAGFLAVARQTQCECEHSPRMLMIQRLECTDVATLRAGDERALGVSVRERRWHRGDVDLGLFQVREHTGSEMPRRGPALERC